MEMGLLLPLPTTAIFLATLLRDMVVFIFRDYIAEKKGKENRLLVSLPLPSSFFGVSVHVANY